MFFSNAVVPCEALPAVDLSFWKDISGGVPQQPVLPYPPQSEFGNDFFLKKK